MKLLKKLLFKKVEELIINKKIIKMAKVSKKPALGVSEEERKRILAKLGYGLKENKRTGDLCAVKKRQTKKAKKQKARK